MESLLDQVCVEAVGDDKRLPFPGENGAPWGESIGPGPKCGLPKLAPSGDWNGLPPPDGTLSRRPGVLEPPTYMLCDRECEEAGEATPEPHLGLVCSVEKVAEVGVLKSLGEGWR